jgi:hypothetical protein
MHDLPTISPVSYAAKENKIKYRYRTVTVAADTFVLSWADSVERPDELCVRTQVGPS